LNISDVSVLYNFKTTIRSLATGMAKLDTYRGTVFRGKGAPTGDIITGSHVIFPAFTSSSLNRDKAIEFATGIPNPTLYVIQACTPRRIRDISFYPEEEECLFGPFSIFKVMGIEFLAPNLQMCTLEEHENPAMLRVVLWVDDEPQNNITEIQQLRARGIVVTQSFTSAEAITYLTAHRYLGQRGLNGFRVITDFRRTEAGTRILDAGRRFIVQLRGLGYNNRVLIYTSEEGRQLAQPHVLAMGNVNITTTTADAIAFGHFQN